MGDSGSINLMPEDLRSRESAAVEKKRQNFQPDLVLPEGSQPKIKEFKVKGPSLWSKMTAMFLPKPKAPRLTEEHEEKKDKHGVDKSKEEQKIKYEVKHVRSVLKEEVNKKHEAQPSFHIPKPGEKPKEQHQDFKQDFNIPKTSEQQPAKVKGPSFWSRLFSSKPKPPKTKEEKHKKVDAVHSVLIEEIKKNGHAEESKPALHIPSLEEQHKKNKEEIKQDFSIPKAFEPTKKVVPTPATSEPRPVPQFHQPEPRIRARFISEGGGVDLIPQSAKTRSWKQIFNLISVSFVGAVVVIGLFYITLFFQEKRKENQKQSEIQQISDLEQKILTYQAINEEIDSLGKDIRLVHSVLSLHFYWTNFFELLEKYTVSDVYYTGLTAGSGGGLTLQAVGADFDSVARQLKLLQQPEAMEFVWFVDVSSASKIENGVSFSVTLGLNPFLFYYDENSNQNIINDDNGGEDNNE